MKRRGKYSGVNDLYQSYHRCCLFLGFAALAYIKVLFWLRILNQKQFSMANKYCMSKHTLMLCILAELDKRGKASAGERGTLPGGR